MGSPVEFAGYTYRVSQKILTTGRCCGAKFAHGHNLGALDTDLVLVRKGQKKNSGKKVIQFQQNVVPEIK